MKQITGLIVVSNKLNRILLLLFYHRLHMVDSEEGPGIPNSEAANLFRKASRVIRFVEFPLPFYTRRKMNESMAEGCSNLEI